jgi:hypothetical protein
MNPDRDIVNSAGGKGSPGDKLPVYTTPVSREGEAYRGNLYERELSTRIMRRSRYIARARSSVGSYPTTPWTRSGGE